MKEKIFRLKHCNLILKESNGLLEILVEAGYQEGAICLGVGEVQILKLKKIFSEIKIGPPSHLKTYAVLSFIRIPATRKEIEERFGNCDSFIRNGLRNETIKSFMDENCITRYTTTGKAAPGRHKLWPGHN